MTSIVLPKQGMRSQGDDIPKGTEIYTIYPATGVSSCRLRTRRQPLARTLSAGGSLPCEVTQTLLTAAMCVALVLRLGQHFYLSLPP